MPRAEGNTDQSRPHLAEIQRLCRRPIAVACPLRKQAMETFVIQIPTRLETEQSARQEEIRGLVEHVGTGQRKRFTNTRELLAFLQTSHPDPQSKPPK